MYFVPLAPVYSRQPRVGSCLHPVMLRRMTVVSGHLARVRPAPLFRVLVAGAATTALAALASILASCGGQPSAELTGDELFSLSIGPLDEQLDLIRSAGAPAPHATRIALRDGLFYIANGNASKVMQLSSHGDLLLLIYDPERNPEPVGLAADPTAPATRVAVSHRFRELGHIAVDSRQRIMVVDAVGDETTGEYGHLVKRFGSDGSYLDAIGREGRSGTPFPFVQRLTVMADDTLVVTARTAAQWVSFWYDATGRLVDRTELAHTGPLADESGLVIRDLLPTLSQRRLLVFVDASGNAAGGVAGGGAGVRLYDVASRSVVASYAVPDAQQRRTAGAGGGAAPGGPGYHPLGVTAEGLLFLTRRDDDRTRSLLVLGQGGRVVLRRHWALDETGLGHVILGMSDRGVLYGLLGAGDRARMVWWRGDLLVADQDGTTGGTP